MRKPVLASSRIRTTQPVRPHQSARPSTAQQIFKTPTTIPRAPPDACMHAETTVSDTYACTVPGHDVSVCRYGLRPVLRVCVCVARAPPHCAECPLPMGSVTSPAGGCVPRSGYVDVQCAARARTTYVRMRSGGLPLCPLPRQSAQQELTVVIRCRTPHPIDSTTLY